MSLLKQGKEILELSFKEATEDRKVIARIKDELQYLQITAKDEDTAREYEKRKDMWAELQVRLQKEIYYVQRVIAPKMSDYIEIKLVEGDKYVEYFVKSQDFMVKLYNEMFNKTNTRVYKMKYIAEQLLENTTNEMLKNDMIMALDLFERKVVSCVQSNIKNQFRFLNKPLRADLKDIDYLTIEDYYV